MVGEAEQVLSNQGLRLVLVQKVVADTLLPYILQAALLRGATLVDATRLDFNDHVYVPRTAPWRRAWQKESPPLLCE